MKAAFSSTIPELLLGQVLHSVRALIVTWEVVCERASEPAQSRLSPSFAVLRTCHLCELLFFSSVK